MSYSQQIETTHPIINTETKLTIIPLLVLIQSQIVSIAASSLVLDVRILVDPSDE